MSIYRSCLAREGDKKCKFNGRGITQGKYNCNVFISANGKKCCPMIAYPYKRIPEKMAQSVPAEWGIARSDRG